MSKPIKKAHTIKISEDVLKKVKISCVHLDSTISQFVEDSIKERLSKLKIGESITIAMARGTIVLDENLANLATSLEKTNIHVIITPKGMKDSEIKKQYLANRIFVTNNTKDFIRDAPILDCGIISTEKIKFKGEDLSKMISNVLTDMKLWSKRHGFLVILNPNNRHEFKPLTD